MRTRFIRKIDKLGRITLPMEMRKSLVLAAYEQESFEILATSQGILIKPYKSAYECHCCNEFKHMLVSYNDIKLCNACIDNIAKKAGHTKEGK